MKTRMIILALTFAVSVGGCGKDDWPENYTYIERHDPNPDQRQQQGLPQHEHQVPQHGNHYGSGPTNDYGTGNNCRPRYVVSIGQCTYQGGCNNCGVTFDTGEYGWACDPYQGLSIDPCQGGYR